MTVLKSPTFRDVIDFIAYIKTETEFLGSRESFEAEYPQKLKQLHTGLALDHDPARLTPETILGPQAAAAFEAFQVWYASIRSQP